MLALRANMKLAAKTLFLILLLSSSHLMAKTAKLDVSTEPPLHKNLFMLKTHKRFIGGQVEIYNAKGELITSQSLQKRKMVIDFDPVKLGAYTIKVVQGDASKEYKYIKK